MKKTKMHAIVKSCLKDSISSVECELQKEDVNLNISFLDKNKNKLYPITWCCKKGILSLIEMMVKKGADPNRSFIDDNGQNQTVINWACQQDNASLIEILLQHGSKINMDTIKLARQYHPAILPELSTQVPNLIKELYHSYLYQDVESEEKKLDFNDENPFIFAFNSMQANFIGIRQKNKGVLVDAGDSGSELMKNFQATNKRYKDAADLCGDLIEQFQEFKQCPGKVTKPFATKYRAEPTTTYRTVLNYCRSYCPLETSKFQELETKTIDEEESISEIITHMKDSFLQFEQSKDRHPIRIFFSGEFEIEAVFLTHPHLDHFSLVECLQTNFPDSFRHTKFILGGSQADWMKATHNSIQNWTDVNKTMRSKLANEIKFSSTPSVQSIFEESGSLNQQNESETQSKPSRHCSKEEITSESSTSVPVLFENDSIPTLNESENQDEGTHKPPPILCFTGHEFDSFELTLLDGVVFKVWGRTAPEDPEDKNQLCLLITMFFKGNNVLFTGDAQGNLLQRMKIDRPILQENETFDGIVDDIIDKMENARKSVNKKINVIEYAQQELTSFLQNIAEDEQNQYKNYVSQLLAFENSNVIFEPHHGSMTEGTFDFYDYLSAQNLKQIFLICSYPMPKDYLPKEECITKHKTTNLSTKLHPVTYATNDSILTISMTTNPVYTTGCAGDSVYVLKIGETVDLLDLFDETPQWETILS